MMVVELFHAPGCKKCEQAQADLKAVALRAVDGLEWRELNVLDALDYAVELGVLTLPAIAIDRKLVFTALPTPEQLRKALIRTLGEA